MINKELKKYMKEIHNIDKNYQEILSKEKGAGNMKFNKKKILNIAAILIAVVLVGTLSTQIYAKIQWNIEFKEYQNRDIEYGRASIKEAKETGYDEKIDMDYVIQNGIGVKIDSLMITDNHFETNINFQFPEDTELNSETFGFGIAVYDENNNIYGIQEILNHDKGGYYKYLYEELGVKYNKKDVFAIQLNDSSSQWNVSADNKNIISKFEMNSTEGFPKSEKIYIRVFDLSYYMVDMESKLKEDFVLSEAEWNFEIDVPAKFYKRETLEAKLKENIDRLSIDKISITETGLNITGKKIGLSEDLMNAIDLGENRSDVIDHMIYITDKEGNEYLNLDLGTGKGEDTFQATFDINKNIFEKGVYLNVTFDGKVYTSEIVK